jgi:hypothetical protein
LPGARRHSFGAEQVKLRANDESVLVWNHLGYIVGEKNQESRAVLAGPHDELLITIRATAERVDDTEQPRGCFDAKAHAFPEPASNWLSA